MLCAVGTVAFSAPSQRAARIVNPGQVRWKPSAFPGIRFAVVQGDWNVARTIYTVRFEMPNGSAFPAHYHGSDEVLTVINGTFMFKRGTNMGRSGAQAVRAGGILYITANTPHWGWADGDTIVQINGIGPHSVHVMKP